MQVSAVPTWQGQPCMMWLMYPPVCTIFRSGGFNRTIHTRVSMVDGQTYRYAVCSQSQQASTAASSRVHALCITWIATSHIQLSAQL
jgi:hypothetical protein